MADEDKITIETFKIITHAVAQSDRLDIMTNHLTQLLVAALQIKGCAIFALNPETSDLEMLANFGLSLTYLFKGPIKADKSIGDALNGKPVIIRDAETDPRLQYPAETKKEGIRTIVSIPITFMNDIVGVLRLYHHEVWDISPQDIDSLHLLAANIGLAMSYTRLLNIVTTISEAIGDLPKRLAGF
ncbi:MAG: GAF domain-containing protein [Deltaproteobacteria bacterium]|nr:GAF domain-containing protein [Deltaproteobacteria bacterium]